MQVDTLLHIVDALSYSRLNTLHWHIVDAQSFPIVLPSEPTLAQKGAWTKTAIYTPAQVRAVVDYARKVGVRVVPEIDVPGHAASWGAAYPDITAKCPSLSHNINNIPLNVANEKTYEVLANVMGDIADMFDDQFIHTGGDEVVLDCWTEDAQIAAWMKSKGYKTQADVEQAFEARLVPIVKSLNRSMLVWEEMFNDGVNVGDAIVHVGPPCRRCARDTRRCGRTRRPFRAQLARARTRCSLQVGTWTRWGKSYAIVIVTSVSKSRTRTISTTSGRTPGLTSS